MNADVRKALFGGAVGDEKYPKVWESTSVYHWVPHQFLFNVVYYVKVIVDGYAA